MRHVMSGFYNLRYMSLADNDGMLDIQYRVC